MDTCKNFATHFQISKNCKFEKCEEHFSSNLENRQIFVCFKSKDLEVTRKF
jgi:cobalamin biosynthesis Co2+ chelatase CbiK